MPIPMMPDDAAGAAMMPLNDNDTHHAMTRIPEDVRKMMREHGVMVGGGFLRSVVSGDDVSDIDLFGGDIDKLKLIGAVLANGRQARLHETQNALTILAPPRLPIQIITRWLFPASDTFIALQDLVRSFDFTVCQAAVGWDRQTNRYVSRCSTRFYPDLAARRLVYTSPARDEDSGGSLMRVRKFLMRGYNIQISSLAAVVARLLDGVKDNQIFTSGDAAVRTMIITKKLVEVDPLVVIDGLDVINDHEVSGT